MKGLHLLIFGTVQGVFFRKSAHVEATKLKLKGWVRNRKNGSVELYAEGGEDSLVKMLHWCGKGPPMSKVVRVTTTWSEFSDEFNSFEIRQTC
jgi:acylphosphatase